MNFWTSNNNEVSVLFMFIVLCSVHLYVYIINVFVVGVIFKIIHVVFFSIVLGAQAS
uniref:Sf5 n=1 Tax=Spodoptera frugiperda nuclear polyhedrosis virus TaxID=10455 RepID=A0A891XKC9_NPVSF|nr:Sf5 [Spodoptera frugiperda multiple nucleopolyhedrovirus]